MPTVIVSYCLEREESMFITLFQCYLCFLHLCSQKLFTTLILTKKHETTEPWHFGKGLKILSSFSPVLLTTLTSTRWSCCIEWVMGPASWRKTAWSIWTACGPVHTFPSWLKAEFRFWMALTCLWYLQITLCTLVSGCSIAPSPMQYAVQMYDLELKGVAVPKKQCE